MKWNFVKKYYYLTTEIDKNNIENWLYSLTWLTIIQKVIFHQNRKLYILAERIRIKYDPIKNWYRIMVFIFVSHFLFLSPMYTIWVGFVHHTYVHSGQYIYIYNLLIITIFLSPRTYYYPRNMNILQPNRFILFYFFIYKIIFYCFVLFSKIFII